MLPACCSLPNRAPSSWWPGSPVPARRRSSPSEPRAVDSDALREAWAPRLGRPPLWLWRPLVHARHWVAIWRALKRRDGVIVVRPFTHTSWLRRAVLRRARRHHPAVHLVVVDAFSRPQARAGQHARGRSVGERAMWRAPLSVDDRPARAARRGSQDRGGRRRLRRSAARRSPPPPTSVGLLDDTPRVRSPAHGPPPRTGAAAAPAESRQFTASEGSASSTIAKWAVRPLTSKAR